MAAKKGNRGLSQLFGDDVDDILSEISSSGEKKSQDARLIPVSEIRPNPYQPRTNFDEEALRELTESIREHGVFTPVLIRKSPVGYELIAGERRLRASKLAGLKEIPANVLEIDDRAMMEISILENVQREDLSVIEEAKGYQQLQERFGYTQEELSERIGKSRSHITNILRLLRLPEGIREDVNAGKISFGHARALLGCDDERKQEEIARRIVKEGLSVRETEKLVKGKKKVHIPVKEEDPYIGDVRRNLERKYGTSVSISSKCIMISYKDHQDLNRILEIMDALDQNQ